MRLMVEGPTPPQPDNDLPTGKEAIKGVEDFLEGELPGSTWKAELASPEAREVVPHIQALDKLIDKRLNTIAKKDDSTDTKRYKYWNAVQQMFTAFSHILSNAPAMAGEALPAELEEMLYDDDSWIEDPQGASRLEYRQRVNNQRTRERRAKMRTHIEGMQSRKSPTSTQESVSFAIVAMFEALGLPTEKIQAALQEEKLLSSD